jgi:PmbA protein
MMKEMLDLAEGKSDKAEIFSLEEKTDIIRFENSKLKDIDTKIQSGVSLRIQKEDKLGFAYTKNLYDREELLNNALSSLAGGVEASFDFPSTKKSSVLSTFDPSVEGISTADIVEECKRVSDFLSSKIKGQLDIFAALNISDLGIINSFGTDLKEKFSSYSLSLNVFYPGSSSGIQRSLIGKNFKRTDKKYLNYIINTYNKSLKQVKFNKGRMKVLFMPEAIYVLIWRLLSGCNGKNIYNKQSPILNKLNEKIFDEKLTIYNDPLDDKMPGARSFDDEGVACGYFKLIEKGILKNFYYDLYYAEKMGVKSAGHGFKTAVWGGETVSMKPVPSLEHLYIKPGNKSFSELLALMDRGVIVAGALGAHSGNIPNGDFSIGADPGLYVEDGEIVGHVKDAMISGNIYDTMKNVAAIEDTYHPAYMGTFPAILFDDVSLTV